MACENNEKYMLHAWSLIPVWVSAASVLGLLCFCAASVLGLLYLCAASVRDWASSLLLVCIYIFVGYRWGCHVCVVMCVQ